MNFFFRAGSLLAISASANFSPLHAQLAGAPASLPAGSVATAPTTPAATPAATAPAASTTTTSTATTSAPSSTARVMTVPQMPQTQSQTTNATTRAPQTGAVSARSAVDTIRMRRDLDLMNAAFAGDTPRIRELVGKGANVNSADGSYGFTPLMWAARNGHVGAVRYLLGRGAKINARSKTGVRLIFDARTPAVTYETGSTLNLMLIAERGGVSALAIAAANGWGMAARELIGRGADVNLASPDGDTPLMAAAFNGDVETMKALVARGAKIDAVDIYGHSALWLAALRGQETAARDLLARGAKPAPDSGGTWPSDAAKAMQMRGVATLLARAERAPRAAMKKGVRKPDENRAENRDVPTADRAMTGAGGIIVLN